MIRHTAVLLLCLVCCSPAASFPPPVGDAGADGVADADAGNEDIDASIPIPVPNRQFIEIGDFHACTIGSPCSVAFAHPFLHISLDSSFGSFRLRKVGSAFDQPVIRGQHAIVEPGKDYVVYVDGAPPSIELIEQWLSSREPSRSHPGRYHLISNLRLIASDCVSCNLENVVLESSGYWSEYQGVLLLGSFLTAAHLRFYTDPDHPFVATQFTELGLHRDGVTSARQASSLAASSIEGGIGGAQWVYAELSADAAVGAGGAYHFTAQ